MATVRTTVQFTWEMEMDGETYRGDNIDAMIESDMDTIKGDAMAAVEEQEEPEITVTISVVSDRGEEIKSITDTA